MQISVITRAGPTAPSAFGPLNSTHNRTGMAVDGCGIHGNQMNKDYKVAILHP